MISFIDNVSPVQWVLSRLIFNNGSHYTAFVSPSPSLSYGFNAFPLLKQFNDLRPNISESVKRRTNKYFKFVRFKTKMKISKKMYCRRHFLRIYETMIWLFFSEQMNQTVLKYIYIKIIAILTWQHWQIHFFYFCK